MKTAILADIHGNDVAFQAVVEHMTSLGVNCVVFLGDLVAKGPEPQACYDRLEQLKPLVWIKGNTECWLDNALIDVLPSTPENVEMLDYYGYMTHHMTGPSMDKLIRLKQASKLRFGHFESLCVHGSPRDIEECLDPIGHRDEMFEVFKGVKEPLILSGHCHKQMDEVYHSYRVINPGSVGMGEGPKDPRAHYAILDDTSGLKVTYHQISYDYHQLIQKAKEMKFPNWSKYAQDFGVSLDDMTTSM